MVDDAGKTNLFLSALAIVARRRQAEDRCTGHHQSIARTERKLALLYVTLSAQT